MKLQPLAIKLRNILAAAFVCCALIGFAAPLKAAHEGDTVGYDHHHKAVHSFEFHHCGNNHEHAEHWYHSDGHHDTHDYWCPGTHYPHHDDTHAQPPPE